MALTLKQASFRCIAYKENSGSYTGVCLDLDIVEEGHITLQEAILSINDAIQSHVEAAQKLNYPPKLLDRPAPKEYWDKLLEITRRKVSLPQTISPFQFFTSTPNLDNVMHA